MRKTNIKLNDDGSVVFDPEYFIEGESYVVPSEGNIEEMCLRKYEPYGLIFENDNQIYGLSLEKYAGEILIENKYSLKDFPMRKHDEKMIYRIGKEIGVLTEEKQLFSQMIQQEGLIFLMNQRNEIRILSSTTRSYEKVLLNRLGSLDVSVSVYNTEEFLDRVKKVKKIVYKDDDATFEDINKESLIRKTPTFDELYKDRPLIIVCKSGNGYIKQPSDTMSSTYVVARNKRNLEFICDVEKDFDKAIELVVPTNEIRPSKELFNKISDSCAARVHYLTPKEENKNDN